MAQRCCVYIDGFNLYYGLLKGSSLKWLDIQGLSEKLTPTYDLQRIYYFTARPKNKLKRERQEVYLTALTTRPLVEIVEGSFKMVDAWCGVKACHYSGKRKFSKPEEKRTDVAIAVQMIADAYEDNTDRFLLISGDSDLVPPVSHIQNAFPEKHVRVYVPTTDRYHRSSSELRGAAGSDRTLTRIILRGCSLPRVITADDGEDVVRPTAW